MDPGGHLFSLFQSSAVKHRQDGSEDERWVKRAQCCIWNLSSILALQWRNSFFSKWSKGEVYPVASAFCSSTLKCLAVARPGKCLQTSERSAFLPNELVLCLPKLSNYLSYLRGLIRRRQWHPTPVLLPWKIPWMEEPGRLQSMVAKSWTRLSDFTFTFHFHALEKEMATHSSVLAWRIPGTTGEPDGLPSMGSHRVRHDWSDLAAAAEVLS